MVSQMPIGRIQGFLLGGINQLAMRAVRPVGSTMEELIHLVMAAMVLQSSLEAPWNAVQMWRHPAASTWMVWLIPAPAER